MPDVDEVEALDDVALDEVVSVVDDDVEVLEDVMLDEAVPIADDVTDDVEVLVNVVLLLLDEETCGAEGVAVGVGVSA